MMSSSPWLLADQAPPVRTLLDIVRSTADAFPQEPAIDDGQAVLSYRGLVRRMDRIASKLTAAGVQSGDRVGIRLPSGSSELYSSILAALSIGVAYVPVDYDDPAERARTVFDEADVTAVLTEHGIELRKVRTDAKPVVRAALPDDDAWIIFTSGSTGKPKGVAVTHASAAAFVDAEAVLFDCDKPIGPGDRVLAGLSVAFDASCEEMWLAWRHGACLVPAPRSLVRSAVDLGAWLVRHRITVVSTVPTLAAFWPSEALESVRILIFGGESVPLELSERMAEQVDYVWNTYGPTEATVVSTAALLDGSDPIRIGFPLVGWDVAVVNQQGEPVANGESGELIIGGVGLARYLDPEIDAVKFAPMKTLGWQRAYRTGDMVRLEEHGLVFIGRVDDQIKIGGRRIELGEIDAALAALAGVQAAAAAVRRSQAGHDILVGYLAVPPDAQADFDLASAQAQLRELLPAALVPRLAVLDELPTRTSGKVDRNALPWPLAQAEPPTGPTVELTGTLGWLAEHWLAVLGAPASGPNDDFFTVGGGSLAAAQLTTAIRERYPQATVADIYDHPRIGALATRLEDYDDAATQPTRLVRPVPLGAQAIQLAISIVLLTLTGAQWVTWLAVIGNISHHFADVAWLPTLSWWKTAALLALTVSPLGRMAMSVIGARLLLHGVRAGVYPRGGRVHLRLWAAQRLALASGAEGLSGAPWMALYARALGNKIGPGVDLQTLPPVTGLLEVGAGAAIETEVDLTGVWIDGDQVHVGPIRIGKGATIGTRSTLAPRSRVGAGAIVSAGSVVIGRAKGGRHWMGSPALDAGKAEYTWPQETPARHPVWVVIYALTSLLLAGLPLLGIGVGLGLLLRQTRDQSGALWALGEALVYAPVATAIAVLITALTILAFVRLCGIGLTPGCYPVRSRVGWQAWCVERLMDSARTYLFPFYASLFTPIWLRWLGAKVGRGTEISTAILLPKFTTIDDGAFLADDTMVATYELGGGWMRLDHARIGRRAFLGNSGIAAQGRRVPKDSLVAVLSAAPAKAKARTSWLGSPPVRLRRAVNEADLELTYQPSLKLRVLRALVESARGLALVTTFAIGLVVLFGLASLVQRVGFGAAFALSGVLLAAAGAVAGASAVVTKWALVGRITVGEHPLWSSFVWRNEVADAFVESVAAPWFARAASGTAVMTLWLRALGATIGRGVWCESYWLPEADLVTLGDGATVERGCVVQTHLFHDRVMALDTVILGAGATLGPHCVSLPATSIGAGTTVGPGSLVMRGDQLPPSTRWQGNPITVWHKHRGRGARASHTSMGTV